MRRGPKRRTAAATCKCWHAGSQTPSRYQCSHCYCVGWAASNDEIVGRLIGQDRKLNAESEELRKAKKFRERHPLP